MLSRSFSRRKAAGPRSRPSPAAKARTFTCDGSAAGASAPEVEAHAELLVARVGEEQQTVFRAIDLYRPVGGHGAEVDPGPRPIQVRGKFDLTAGRRLCWQRCRQNIGPRVGKDVLRAFGIIACVPVVQSSGYPRLRSDGEKTPLRQLMPTDPPARGRQFTQSVSPLS